MFCKTCGAEVGESQKFCGICGTSSTAMIAEPQSKGKRSRLAILLGIFFILALYYLTQQKTPNAPPAEATRAEPSSDAAQGTLQNAASAPTDSSQRPPPDNPPQTYNLGQPFSVGHWSYRCDGAYWTPILGFDLYSMERASAEFIVVDITARNDDTSSSTMPPFHLVDEEGRTYNESSATTLNQGFFSGLEQLNPGVSKRGKIAFDVPPDRQYSLLLSGGIESGKRALVVLPMPTPASAPVTPQPTGQPSENAEPKVE